MVNITMEQIILIEFFPPNSRALLPTFLTHCPDGSHFQVCPDGVSFWPEYHSQALFFTPPSHISFRDMCAHKHPEPHPKTPFPGLNFVQNELPSGHCGQPGPQLGTMFKKCTNFFKKWAKKIIHQIIFILSYHCYARKASSARLQNSAESLVCSVTNCSGTHFVHPSLRVSTKCL